MEYNKTVNLPKTSFSMKAELTKKEPLIQKTWEEKNIYKRMVEKNKDGSMYILHDGPPYANGHIHLGHALNKILKDIIIKYKSLNGYFTPFIPGWDCHGLPIEYQIFKDKHLKKEQIDYVQFRKEAADYAKKFIEIQKKEFKRLGVFADWENVYLTLNKEYEASIINVFKRLVSKHYIYRMKKPVYWCFDCQTALAEAEIEYQDKFSDSIYVKFPVKEWETEKNTKFSVLIWTTTPWTLPANKAVAFNPNEEYLFWKVDGEILLIAKHRLADIQSKFNKTGSIIKKIIGEKLKGIKVISPISKDVSIGILADFVSLEEGTGVVHIAPGHGEEDFQIGIKNNLEVFSPVDEKGRFTKEIERYEGLNVFKSNEKIMNELESEGLLLYKEKIKHSYPHCWRCKNPVIFRATPQWFLSIDENKLRIKMLSSIRNTEWIPSFGEKRIYSMVEFRPDWCLSRQRFWGVPIPVFYCNKCNEPILSEDVISVVEELFRKEGSDIWFVKTPEEILPKDIKCKRCKSTLFRKENDILDVWFDSGISHEAVLKSSSLHWPAELYLEGSDQHRGWFQTSLITAVATEERAPYKTVLTHGFVVDGEGKKMSKSLGNVISPQEVIDKYGADILRLWTSSENYQDDIRISERILEQLVDGYRKVRNTFKFLLGNIYDFTEKDKLDYIELKEIDKFMLHRLQILIKDVKEEYDRFLFHHVFRKIHNFCVIELSSFYLDILKDRLYTFSSNHKLRRSSQTVLYELIFNLVNLISPILSFTAEEVWSYLKEKFNTFSESVFLSDFPNINEDYISYELERKWNKILEIKEEVNKALEIARTKKLIGNSLEAKVIISSSETVIRDIDWEETLIVSQFEFKDVFSVSPPVIMKSQILTDLTIGIDKASGKKCIRCWRYCESVGNDFIHPQLCARCIKMLKK